MALEWNNSGWSVRGSEIILMKGIGLGLIISLIESLYTKKVDMTASGSILLNTFRILGWMYQLAPFLATWEIALFDLSKTKDKKLEESSGR